METLKQFTVASRNAAKPIRSTLEVIKSALQSVPESRVVSVDQHTGVIVVEIPSSEAERVQRELGRDFMFDPNSRLRY